VERVPRPVVGVTTVAESSYEAGGREGRKGCRDLHVSFRTSPPAVEGGPGGAQARAGLSLSTLTILRKIVTAHFIFRPDDNQPNRPGGDQHRPCAVPAQPPACVHQASTSPFMTRQLVFVTSRTGFICCPSTAFFRLDDCRSGRARRRRPLPPRRTKPCSSLAGQSPAPPVSLGRTVRPQQSLDRYTEFTLTGSRGGAAKTIETRINEVARNDDSRRRSPSEWRATIGSVRVARELACFHDDLVHE
jgi:hypothetical protein